MVGDTFMVMDRVCASECTCVLLLLFTNSMLRVVN